MKKDLALHVNKLNLLNLKLIIKQQNDGEVYKNERPFCFC